MRKYNRSATELGVVQDFLSQRCVKTGFHYAAVMGMTGRDQVVSFCAGCRGWQRRVHHSGKRHRHFTPVDHVIYVVLSPGAAPDLDQRNWHYCAQRILDAENLFLDVLPVAVQSILAEMLQSSPSSDHREVLAKTWYKYNENPEFFSSGKLAAIMKRFAV